MPTLSESGVGLCILFILLVPMAGAGLALLNTGLGRSRSAAHSMLNSLCVLSVAALVYYVCGFAWQGYIGRAGHTFATGTKSWNWLAAEPFFYRGLALDGSPASLAAFLQTFSVGLAAMIPLGAGCDRWRLSASCISTALLAGWTYPLFAHWVWGGGWLAQLRFLDAGGASTIQAVGGLTALAIALILGPRRGKYSLDGMPAAIPGHTSVLVLFGCLLAMVGWLGLNCAGAMLFSAVEPGHAVLVAVNTMLSASAAGLAAVVVTRLRFGKPDASLVANGWVGGLVASSAVCAFVRPGAAIVIGAVAGILVTLAVEVLELRLAVDDPAGAISVHAIAAIWGLLAVGALGRGPGQWLAQLVGLATLLGFVFPLTYTLNWLLDQVHPQRVAAEGERQGMDVYELGGSAYPEFVTHTEDFLQR